MIDIMLINKLCSGAMTYYEKKEGDEKRLFKPSIKVVLTPYARLMETGLHNLFYGFYHLVGVRYIERFQGSTEGDRGIGRCNPFYRCFQAVECPVCH